MKMLVVFLASLFALPAAQALGTERLVLADILLEQGRPQEALAEYKSALILSPQEFGHMKSVVASAKLAVT